MSDEDMRLSVVFVGEDYGLVIVAHGTVTPEYLPENVLTQVSIWETGYGVSFTSLWLRTLSPAICYRKVPGCLGELLEMVVAFLLPVNSSGVALLGDVPLLKWVWEVYRCGGGFWGLFCLSFAQYHRPLPVAFWSRCSLHRVCLYAAVMIVDMFSFIRVAVVMVSLHRNRTPRRRARVWKHACSKEEAAEVMWYLFHLVERAKMAMSNWLSCKVEETSFLET